MSTIYADLYIRLSDALYEEQFDGRKEKLCAEAARLGWTVHRVIRENDTETLPDGTERILPASAFKRVKMITPSGKTELRVNRPGFRQMIADIESGAVSAVLAEDLDRVARDPKDMEDLIAVCELRGASARSLSRSLTLTDGGTPNEQFIARLMVGIAQKSSQDTARRMADSWERRAGLSYCGGNRPFGYERDPSGGPYHRTLAIAEGEAAIIRAAAADVLDRGVSLRAIAIALRDAGIPTVRGGPWKTTTVRTMLTGTAVAGLTYRRDELITAPWPAILDRGTWDRLRALFADPARLAHHGTEPKWLVSVFARCGVCQGMMVVNGGSGEGPRAPRYAGRDCCHLSRDAGWVDGHIADLVVARLGKPDIRDGGLLTPPPRATPDAGRLLAEKKKILARLDSQARKNALGQLSDRQLAAGHKAGTERIAVIDARLAAAVSGPDPVPEFRGDVLALQAWEGLTVARRRAVVQALVKSVTIMRALPGSHVFDPSKIVVVAADGVPWPELAAA